MIYYIYNILINFLKDIFKEIKDIINDENDDYNFR